MKNSISLKTKIALLLTISFWSSAFVGIRMGLQTYSPGGSGLLRFIVASVCMFLFYQKFSKKEYIPLKDKILLLITGAVGIGLYHVALNYGELSVPSGVASFIISQSPIITSIFAVLFLSESVSRFGFLGMIISLFGVLLISISHTQGFSFDKGLFYIAFATVVGSFYSIIQKPFLKKYDLLDITAYLVWGGTFMLVIYFPDLKQDYANASLASTLAIIYLGIFPGAIAYIAWSFILKEIPASKAVSFLYFMPILATLLGWIGLGEVPVIMSLIGGLIALFGVWVVNKWGKIA